MLPDNALDPAEAQHDALGRVELHREACLRADCCQLGVVLIAQCAASNGHTSEATDGVKRIDLSKIGLTFTSSGYLPTRPGINEPTIE